MSPCGRSWVYDSPVPLGRPQDREIWRRERVLPLRVRQAPKEEPCPPQSWYAQPTVRSLSKALAKEDR